MKSDDFSGKEFASLALVCIRSRCGLVIVKSQVATFFIKETSTQKKTPTRFLMWCTQIMLFSTSHDRRLLKRSHRSRGVRSAHPCHCLYSDVSFFFLRLRAHRGVRPQGQVCVEKGGGLPHQSPPLKQTKELTTPFRGLLGKSPLHSQARAGGKRRKVRTEPKQTMCSSAKDTHHITHHAHVRMAYSLPRQAPALFKQASLWSKL